MPHVLRQVEERQDRWKGEEEVLECRSGMLQELKLVDVREVDELQAADVIHVRRELVGSTSVGRQENRKWKLLRTRQEAKEEASVHLRWLVLQIDDGVAQRRPKFGHV